MKSTIFQACLTILLLAVALCNNFDQIMLYLEIDDMKECYLFIKVRKVTLTYDTNTSGGSFQPEIANPYDFENIKMFDIGCDKAANAALRLGYEDKSEIMTIKQGECFLVSGTAKIDKNDFMQSEHDKKILLFKKRDTAKNDNPNEIFNFIPLRQCANNQPFTFIDTPRKFILLM